MHYHRTLNRWTNTPAAILPEKAEEIREFFRIKGAGRAVEVATVQMLARERNERLQLLHTEIDAALPAASDGNEHPGAIVRGRVAVLPILGVLAQRVSMLEEFSGGISTQAIGRTLDGVMADKSIKAITLVFDSPGGSVFGVQELGDKIAKAAKEKKIVGLADSMAASAAYHLLSQAGEVVVSPGGQVGSIGVFIAHDDVSQALESQGIKTTYIASAPEKVEMAPELPLTDEARAHLQSQVDYYMDKFVRAVAKGRSVTERKVRHDFGGGRMVVAEDAVSRGMADRIGTIGQVLSRLGESNSTAARAAYRARAVEIS